MSRIGKQPIAIPAKVKVDVKGSKVFVEGPKGKLDMELGHRADRRQFVHDVRTEAYHLFQAAIGKVRIMPPGSFLWLKLVGV